MDFASIQIRSEKPSDVGQIFDLHLAAFGQENEGKLVNKLREGKHFIPALSIVASFDNKLIGHILFTHIQIKGVHAYPSLALAPMAVLPAFQGNGIGSTLIRTGIEKATQLGHSSIIVLGHPTYYPKFGFQPASKWQISCPFPVADEAFMVLELVPQALLGKSGTVQYAPAFMQV